jgi:TP901 family phage tail tape measure protein
MSFFSGGAVGISIGAHVAREGFVQGEKYMDSAQVQAARGAHLRVTGDIVKDGFERIGRQLKQTKAEAEKTGVDSSASLKKIDDSMTRTAAVATDRLGVVRRELGLTQRSYMTVGEAANHTATEVARASEREAAAVTAASEKKRTAMMGGSGGRGGPPGVVTTAPFGKAGDEAGKAWTKSYEKAANLGKWVVLGAAGLGIISVKVAADFQRQMEMVHTQAGYSQESVKELTKQVEKLAPAVGIGPTKLAEGLFHLASAGIPASKAMEVLGKAAQLAKVGASDMDETTYALVSLLKAAPKDIHNASEAVGVMNDIVGHGDLRMKDLVKALGSGIVPAAKAVGLGLRDTGAALDVLTARGIPAEQAATRLRTTLGLVDHPTAKATKALGELGIAHDDLAKEFEKHGIGGALDFLQEHLDKAFPKGRALTVEETRAAVKTYAHQLEETGVEGTKAAKLIEQFEKKLKESGSAAIQQSNIIAEAFGGARIGTTWQILMQNIDDVKGHVDTLARPDAAGRFNKIWDETQKEFSVKASKIGASLLELGNKIGQWLIPKIESFVNWLSKAAHWLGKHKAILEGLITLITGALAVAVAAFFAKITLSLGKALKEFGRFLGLVGESPAKVGAATSKIVASFDEQALAVDKVTTAVETLGAQADATMIQMGRLAATGEAVTAGGVVMPRGTTGAAARAEKEAAAALPAEEAALAGSGGLFSKVGAKAKGRFKLPGKAGLGGAAGRGFTTFLVGDILSGIAGEMIGGKAGKDASSIGKTAALGAGLGSFLGPEGALAGGVLGGLVGGFKLFKGQTEGEKIAHDVAKGMSKEIGDTLAKELDDGNKKAQELEDKRQRERAKDHPSKVTHHGVHALPHLTPEQEREAQQVKERAEQAAGTKFITSAVAEQVKVTPGGPSSKFIGILDYVVPRLEKLKGQAQAAGAETLIHLVKGMESKKELPKHSVDELVKTLGTQFPKMKSLFKRAGEESEKALADSAKGKQVLDNTTHFLSKLRNIFVAFNGDRTFETKLTEANALEIFKKANAKLEEEEHSKDEFRRKAAKERRNKLKQDEETWYDARIKNVDQRLADLNSHQHKKTQKGNEELGKLYNARQSIIEDQVAAGIKSQDEGTDAINKQFEAELKALGVDPKKLKKIEGALGKVNKAVGAGLKSIKLAQGGIPNPGGSGADDHLVLDASGSPVAAISGTEGIINRPQMGVVDMALGITKAMGILPYGGLHDLWNSGMTHYAKGGDLSHYSLPLPRNQMYPGSWSLDQGVDIPAPANTPEFAIGPGRIVMEGISGFGPNAPVLNITAGPLAGKNIYYGHAGPDLVRVGDTVSAGQQISRVGAGIVGISSGPHIEIGFGPPFSRASAPDMAQLLKELLSGSTVTGVASAGGAGGAGLPEPKEIKAGKWKGPGGAIGAIGETILNKTAKAANEQLHKQWEQSGAGGGASGPVGELVPGILNIAKEAAAAAHVPWNANIVSTLLSKESSGGHNTAPTNYGHGLDPAGPFQVISSTFNAYARPGHHNRMNPLDNALAAFFYIKSRYGTLPNLASATGLFTSGKYKGYRLGGLLRRLESWRYD